MPTLKSVLFCLVAVSPAAFAQSGSLDLLSFAMPGAKIVAGAHVDTAKSSAFGQFVLSQIQSSNPELQKFIQETGVDPRTDIKEVVVATDSTPGSSMHAVVAVHGNFSNAISVLEASALSHGGTIEHKGGVDLIHMGTAEGSGPQGCIALYIDAATAVGGDCDSVQAGIAAANSKAPTGTPVLAKAQETRGQQDLWFAGVIPVGQLPMGMPTGGPNPLMNSQLIQSIQLASGGVRFAGGSGTQGPTVQLTGAALMDTPQNATSLMNVVNFFVSMIQMRGASEPDAAPFLALLRNLQTSVSGNSLIVSLSIPESSLEQLFQQVHSRASAEPAGVDGPRRHEVHQ